MTEQERHVAKLQAIVDLKDGQLIEQSEKNVELRAALDKLLVLSQMTDQIEKP